MKHRAFVAVAACAALFATPLLAAGMETDIETLLKQKEEEILLLQKEHAQIQEKLKALEGAPSLTSAALTAKNLQRLREIAADVKGQRQTMAEFEAFVKWMAGNLSGYAKYVEAGSVAAGFAKILPIPYAGQASLFTKFISQGILSLNAASGSINRYLVTSDQFLKKVDAIDPAKPKVTDVADAGRFADEHLLKDMTDLQAKLGTAGEISSSTLSFLESLQHYVGSTDEYWKKTKAFLAKGDEKKEKSFLVDSIAGLKSRAGSFNARLKLFDETARKDVPLIKTLGAYNELIHELEGNVVAVK
ncbi:hypothetical protein [Geobacter sp. DSM 9736]|uniref:hypothetical protein n=1 Tax=Geobacter sp. DSM 9736 TaxID=1277350 RepID=UPI000B50670E|nr:hypothetical protein [Geobacter sp. DSM 9736]SNB47704.1 hypothetical protein SAMN06269301_3196 [Geobacter sp. DSM 9736]